MQVDCPRELLICFRDQSLPQSDYMQYILKAVLMCSYEIKLNPAKNTNKLLKPVLSLIAFSDTFYILNVNRIGWR